MSALRRNGSIPIFGIFAPVRCGKIIFY
ncbi:hypothetical protein BQ8794_60250 [Mesorhizobium prunaredense]|uniref:Uncharacterized protein n=1 Tax=Mesorhizobium prunaredense TaxID=1631249 RepID=A0A1R3VGC2_9HYPH|nr:hypothetical protein BQ8794_60250 [Mesorhizobium prunaredense]